MEHVVCLPDSDRAIHVDVKSNAWFVTVKDQCYAIGNGDSGSTLAVLPFLELSLTQVEEAVSEFVKRFNHVEFPFELFIQAGFEHGSPHWTDCSLTWFAEIDRLETSFKDDLEKVAANTKRYSQKSRQLARKLIKQGR